MDNRRKFEERKLAVTHPCFEKQGIVASTSHTIVNPEVISEKRENEVISVKRRLPEGNNNSGAKKRIKLEDFIRMYSNRPAPEPQKTEQKANDSPDKRKFNENDHSAPSSSSSNRDPRIYNRRDVSAGARNNRDRSDDRYRTREREDKPRGIVYERERRNEIEDRERNGERERDRSRSGERRRLDDRERRDEQRGVDRNGNNRERRESERSDEGRERNGGRNNDVVPFHVHEIDVSPGRSDSNESIYKSAERIYSLPPWSAFDDALFSKRKRNSMYWHTTPDTEFDLLNPNDEVITVKNVIVKYREPPESRVPERHWMLYLSTGVSSYTTISMYAESAYLIGRDDRDSVDMIVDHPSCSRRHAVLQHRLVPFRREDSSWGRRIRPFIFDLASTNGTYLNDKRIEPRRYIALKPWSKLRFGCDFWNYIVTIESHPKEDADDDVVETPTSE